MSGVANVVSKTVARLSYSGLKPSSSLHPIKKTQFTVNPVDGSVAPVSSIIKVVMQLRISIFVKMTVSVVFFKFYLFIYFCAFLGMGGWVEGVVLY